MPANNVLIIYTQNYFFVELRKLKKRMNVDNLKCGRIRKQALIKKWKEIFSLKKKIFISFFLYECMHVCSVTQE